ncbi:MAG: 5'-nucleotidase [Betaproteobacteria bacterium]|jgi:5'-nucleotidase|nr:5'-nucleotidase [Betaproteobacteria bacterium]MDG1096912.1 5'-nucleotidase [Methylophilaceae bacterium]MDG1454409.1 5'-nucleotidase [Methylophilaceae bacterium]
MALDLSNTLVVGISATALFDLGEADRLFQERLKVDVEKAVIEYRQYMLARESEPLLNGTGMPLIRALLELNKFHQKDEAPLVEVVVMSRNSPETGVRVFNNIRKLGLKISRHAFTGGESVADYIEAFDVDLFLTTNLKDAQKVMDAGKCAVALLKEPPKDIEQLPSDQVRIAFDGDAVLFDESSELIFKSKGLDEFQQNEDLQQHVPMLEGPYASFLQKLAKLQSRLPFGVEMSPIRLAIVTARSAPAEMRVINTLRHWGVYVNEVFFLGGLNKAAILKAFKPHIFFDDQDLHIETASKLVPAGKVPYKTDSLLNKQK